MAQKPSAPKGGIDFARLTARLKPCPDTKPPLILSSTTGGARLWVFKGAAVALAMTGWRGKLAAT